MNPSNQSPQKSTVEEIRARFDREVERFSILETGQAATIDAPLVLELITASAAGATPNAKRLLDIGCGAGNYTLKMLQRLPNLDVTLIDLSRPMLDRARQRVSAISRGNIDSLQSDIRALDLGEEKFDIILAAAVLHHLRTDSEWHSVFTKIHRALTPGGSFWISDLIDHTLPSVQTEMKSRYGDYLRNLKNEEYRQTVFDYVEKEDTPRPLIYQLDLLRTVGFQKIELLHKNSIFAAFGAQK
jgi:tRNA (cmo5U34)-methyltransferase